MKGLLRVAISTMTARKYRIFSMMLLFLPACHSFRRYSPIFSIVKGCTGGLRERSKFDYESNYKKKQQFVNGCVKTKTDV
jgi:hypothetical protein